MRISICSFFSLFFVFVVAGVADATTLNYYALPAEHSDLNPNSAFAGHTFWLPGIEGVDTQHDSTATSLTFDENEVDGTAHLYGTIFEMHTGGTGGSVLEVDILFSGRTDTAPDGSPKLELWPEAYTDMGGPVDPSTWYYYTAASGTLSGYKTAAELEHISLTVNGLTGPAFQMGYGANGKNTELGGSGWFLIEGSMTSQGQTTPIAEFVGDINMSLTPVTVTPVPEPSVVVLVGGGLLGLAAARRRLT